MKNYGLYDQNLDKDLGVITLSLAMLEWLYEDYYWLHRIMEPYGYCKVTVLSKVIAILLDMSVYIQNGYTSTTLLTISIALNSN